MTLSRTTVGKWHMISGTITEVLTELDTAGIRVDMIVHMKEDATVCIYRHGA